MKEAKHFEKEKEARKLAYFLPNTFTALNMGCGFISTIYSINGNFYYACLILILGAIFDSVDGRVARLTGTQSSFGEQFDSISDVISFGVAPAMIIYHRFFIGFGKLGIICAFFFCLCGALRLARFNANIDKVSSAYFQGLPIPAGAMAIIGYVLFSLEWNLLNDYPQVAMVYTVFYGLLMVSNIPFYSFKKIGALKEKKKLLLFLIFVFFSLIYIYESLIIGPLILIYVIGCLGYFFTHKGELSNVFEWKADSEAQ